MKKILFAVLALAAMASCSKDEVIEVNREQIAFGEAFVENSTRATDNTYKSGKDVPSFKVWGTVKGTHTGSEEVVIFPGTLVSRPDGLTGYNPATAWICDNVQYWVPNAKYNFTAVVDGEYNLETKKIAYTVADQKDLLLATATASVSNEGVVTGTNEKGLVAFTFNHLLSKAYFTFKTTDAFATNAYTYEISNIKFANAYTSGNYTVGGDWEATDKAALSFGDNTVTLAPSKTTAVETTSEYARVFIPQQDIQVLFTITMKYGGKAVSVKEYNYTVFKETDAVKKSVAGHQYNFVVNVAENNTIQFTVNSDPVWTDGGNINVQ